MKHVYLFGDLVPIKQKGLKTDAAFPVFWGVPLRLCLLLSAISDL